MTARQSVELHDAVLLSNIRLYQSTRLAGPHVLRPLGLRCAILFAITAFHALLYWLLADSAAITLGHSAAAPLVSVFIRPRVARADGPKPARTLSTVLILPADAPIAREAFADLDRPITEILGIGTMAPYPEADTGVSAEDVRRAGLQEGEGATVVLRVEVYGTGDVGRVEVEVSGGSERVNEAAISYARSLPWAGGKVDGIPETMWVRWGVRLQA